MGSYEKKIFEIVKQTVSSNNEISDKVSIELVDRIYQVMADKCEDHRKQIIDLVEKIKDITVEKKNADK